jgi:hypothetical protein
MKTDKGLAYLSQFAKKGQTIAGHTFKEDGKLSDHDLQILDVSLENYDEIYPTTVKGLFSANYNSEKNNITFTLKLMSQGADKYSVGETFTHESMLHGGMIKLLVDGFTKGGKEGFETAQDKGIKDNPAGVRDHEGMKNKDLKTTFKDYKELRDQLFKVNRMYIGEFKKAQKEAQQKY